MTSEIHWKASRIVEVITNECMRDTWDPMVRYQLKIIQTQLDQCKLISVDQRRIYKETFKRPIYI